MAVTMNKPRLGRGFNPVQAPQRSSERPQQRSSEPAPQSPSKPAAHAAIRASRAGLSIGALGLGASVFVVVRLFESWRVSAHASSRHISILGQKLSYPVANVDALVVLVLAALGLVATILTVVGAVRELASSRRLARHLAAADPELLKGALLIDDPRPQAFCAGLFRPRVYVSTGAVELLDEPALDAVLAHERHHALRHDPFRLAAGRVLTRALFFLPGLRDLARHQQALAELSADESAINTAPGNRSALARAMLSFSDDEAAGDGAGIDPARVDYLLGEAPSWRFPSLLFLAGGAAIALVVAVAVLAGQLAAGSATLAPPFLSHQPCIVVLALIPAALALGAARVARSLRPRGVTVAASGD
jgi:Zn-dependent protease with chaperone function